jgi:thiol:disulfide interchange protein
MMLRQNTKICSVVCVLLSSGLVYSAQQENTVKVDVVTISVEKQFDAVKPGAQSALAVHFELEKNWHFYASAETAPGEMNLKITPSAEKYITFSEPIFPAGVMYFDKASGQKLEVFSDRFTVYLPFSVAMAQTQEAVKAPISIGIEGAVCSDVQCRVPNFGKLTTTLKISSDALMTGPRFTIPAPQMQAKPKMAEGAAGFSLWFALGLAFLAGLSLNIMPCVWPVLPIIVMRLVEQAKENKSKSVFMGFAFCAGILLFFAALAATNIILQVFYGTVLQWGDQYRNPAFVAAMSLLLIVLALFMFGIFSITLPSSLAGKSSAGRGYGGSIGMGFLAAILSTPCSFAILAAAFAWAQSQPLLPATIAIMVIGIGMALPYAILVSMPRLLGRIPRAGRWMDLFKQAIGFVLLIIAVKLITALPHERLVNVLYFSVILAFCVWMWGSWVTYDMSMARKWLIRIIAVAVAVVAGFVFLQAPKAELIAWQKYDADVIQKAIDEDRPVLIDFTAGWCLSCQVVNKVVFSRRDIADLIKEKNVLPIKADTTLQDSPATLALKNVYNEPGVPVTLLYMPGNPEPIRWHSLSFGDELKAQLEKLK